MEEEFIHKFKRKIKENPFVPLGLILSVFGVISMAKKHHNQDKLGFQNAQRFRMTASFATIMAVVGGYFVQNRDRVKQDWEEYKTR